MKTFLLLVLSLFFLNACSSKTIKNPEATRSMLFPNGTYQHEVHVRFVHTVPGQPDHFDLSGVVKISNKEVKVIGLSPMNTTLFRLSENRESGQIEVQTYVDSLKKFESHLRDYYLVMRKFLLTPLNSENPEPQQAQFDSPSGPVQVFFKNYDQNKIPVKVLVQSPQFEIEIRVVGYAL